MKRIIVATALLLVMMSCGGKKETAQQEEFVVNEAQGSSVQDQIAEGEALVKASDCKTCHHPTNKIIGPPHTEVAQKYEFTAANVSMLAEKIIKGGQGVWGQIPMTPHPQLKQEDVEQMIKYILLLKK